MIHPCKILVENFLMPLNISKYRIAKDINFLVTGINETVLTAHFNLENRIEAIGEETSAFTNNDSEVSSKMTKARFSRPWLALGIKNMTGCRTTPMEKTKLMNQSWETL